MRFIFSKRGETLLEVLISLTILVVGMMATLRLISASSVNNQLTKERVIATNLAREGLEAVRNIRDTNWLRYAGEKRICWNNLDLSKCLDGDGNGVADTAIGHRKAYTATFDISSAYRWQLNSFGTRLDISNGIDAQDENYRLYLKDDLYQHAGTEKTPFFREIYTEYLNNTATGLAADETANVLRVTAKVQWYDRGKISDVTLTTILTDFLGRQDHS